jgi:hypothetical protein
MAQEISQNTDSENSSLRKIEKDTSFSLGQYGAQYKTTGTTTGSFGAIQALEDVSLTVISTNWNDATAAAPATLSSVAVPAGMTIFGDFTSFTTSGKVLAYKNS